MQHLSPIAKALQAFAYKDLLQSAGDVFFLVDGQFILQDISDNVAQLLKYNKDEITGKSIKDFLVQFSASSIEEILKTRKVSTQSFKLIDKDGNQVFVECFLRPHLGPNGKILFAGLARNVTETLQAQRRLKQKNKQVLALLKTKEQFLANMSHEIRTPMNGIIGLLDLLALEVPKGVAAGYLQTIKASSETLLHLVNDILDISKISSDLFILRPTPHYIQKIFSDIHSLYSPLAQRKGLQLTVHTEELIDKAILIDAIRFSQVIGNFVSNAIKFTHQGSIQLRAGLHPRSPVEGALLITIADSGPGIADEDKAKLFKLFSQLDNAHTRSQTGSGLGLYIAKKIIEQMGGSVSFESTIGLGTVFSLEILVEFVVEDTKQLGGLAPQLVPKSLKNNIELPVRSVLVIDDNATNIWVAQALLHSISQKTAAALSGYAALYSLVSSPVPDIILLDIQMPGISGFQTLALLRQIEELAHVPIVALTAYASPKEVLAIRTFGFNGCITKPVTADKLSELLHGYNSLLPDMAHTTNSFGLQKLLFDEAIRSKLVAIIGKESYVETAMEHLDEVQTRLQNLVKSGSAALESELHTLKGSSYTLGLCGLGQAAKFYEDYVLADVEISLREVVTVLNFISNISRKFVY